ncbi:hypothetical protein ACVWW2_001817 [Bradyrhizobium sp. LM4.3]
MDAVEAKQMGVGLDRAEVVDADDLDVLAAGLSDGPQDVAADAAKKKPLIPTRTTMFRLLMTVQ